jgi:hypothetical protein
MSLQVAMQTYKSFARKKSQQAADGLDPLAMMYGGNIAAACKATNQCVTEGKEQELDANEEKKRQRASNRLAAWQSRERKRIEFEVMKERKAELEKQNEDLKRENEQLGRVIQQVKEAKRMQVGGGATSRQITAATHAVAASNFSKMHQQKQEDPKMRVSLSASNMRKDLPPLMPSQDDGVSWRLPARVHPHGANAPYIQQGVATTIFAPLERQQHLEHQLRQALQLGGDAADIASHLEREALQLPYFRTLAKLSPTKRKDAQEESTTPAASPTKRSRKEL